MGKYSEDFKLRAVALAKEIGHKAATDKLGIGNGSTRNWQLKFEGSGKVSKADMKLFSAESAEEELRRLRKENSDLKKANIILKSAAAFFSQDHLK